MAWGTLVAAALGAVFGIGSTVITDLLRSRRDDDRQWAETKRLVYVRFLVALAQAHSRMVVVAFNGLQSAERIAAVHRAFHEDPQHSSAKSVLRELGITAPPAVHREGLAVYQKLREVRELLADETITLETPEYHETVVEFFAMLDALQNAMRNDLQPRQPRTRNKPSAPKIAPLPALQELDPSAD